jgi:hypothetical protein
MEIGDKIWKIEINKPQERKGSIRKEGIHIKEHKVIGVNDIQACIDDLHFSKLRKREKGERRESYHTYSNDIYVNIRTNDSLLGNGIYIYVYSSKKPTKNLLKKMVSKASVEINTKYEFLMNSVGSDLMDMVGNYELRK